MNVANLPTDMRYYKPQYVNATSVSPSGHNHDMTAKELTGRIMNRKLSAHIPIELHAAIREARFYGEWDSKARLEQSLDNLIGSILLDLKSEAEEGSLAMEWIKNRLQEFDNPIANYVPVIPPLRHPEWIIQFNSLDNSATANTGYDNEASAYSTEQELTDHLKKGFMLVMGKKLEIQQSLNEELLNLGVRE